MSNHEISNSKIDAANGFVFNKEALLPTKQHPFDHFFILGELNKNTPKFKKN